MHINFTELHVSMTLFFYLYFAQFFPRNSASSNESCIRRIPNTLTKRVHTGCVSWMWAPTLEVSFAQSLF